MSLKKAIEVEVDGVRQNAYMATILNKVKEENIVTKPYEVVRPFFNGNDDEFRSFLNTHKLKEPDVNFSSKNFLKTGFGEYLQKLFNAMRSESPNNAKYFKLFDMKLLDPRKIGIASFNYKERSGEYKGQPANPYEEISFDFSKLDKNEFELLINEYQKNMKEDNFAFLSFINFDKKNQIIKFTHSNKILIEDKKEDGSFTFLLSYDGSSSDKKDKDENIIGKDARYNLPFKTTQPKKSNPIYGMIVEKLYKSLDKTLPEYEFLFQSGYNATYGKSWFLEGHEASEDELNAIEVLKGASDKAKANTQNLRKSLPKGASKEVVEGKNPTQLSEVLNEDRTNNSTIVSDAVDNTINQLLKDDEDEVFEQYINDEDILVPENLSTSRELVSIDQLIPTVNVKEGYNFSVTFKNEDTTNIEILTKDEILDLIDINNIDKYLEQLDAKSNAKLKEVLENSVLKNSLIALVDVSPHEMDKNLEVYNIVMEYQTKNETWEEKIALNKKDLLEFLNSIELDAYLKNITDAKEIELFSQLGFNVVSDEKNEIVSENFIKAFSKDNTILNQTIVQLTKNKESFLLAYDSANDGEKELQAFNKIFGDYNKYISNENERLNLNIPLFDYDKVMAYDSTTIFEKEIDTLVNNLSSIIDDLKNNKEPKKIDKNQINEEVKKDPVQAKEEPQSESKEDTLNFEGNEATTIVKDLEDKANDTFEKSISSTDKYFEKLKEDAKEEALNSLEIFKQRITENNEGIITVYEAMQQQNRNNPFAKRYFEDLVKNELLLVPTKDKVIEKLVEITGKKKDKIKDLSQAMKQLEEAKASMVQKHESDIKAIEKTLEEVAGEYQKYVSESSTQMEELQEHITTGKELIESLSLQNEELEKQNEYKKEQLKTLPMMKEQLKVTKEVLETKNELVDDLKLQNKTLDKNLEVLQKNMETKDTELGDLKSSFKEKVAEVSKYQDLLKVANEEVQEYKSKYELQATSNAELEQEIKAIHEINNALREELAEERKKYENAEERNKALELQNRQLQELSKMKQATKNILKKANYTQPLNQKELDKVYNDLQNDKNPNLETVIKVGLCKGKYDENKLQEEQKNILDCLVEVGIVNKTKGFYGVEVGYKRFLFENRDETLENIAINFESFFNPSKTKDNTSKANEFSRKNKPEIKSGWITKEGGFDALSELDKISASSSYDSWSKERIENNQKVFSKEDYVDYVQNQHKDKENSQNSSNESNNNSFKRKQRN